ncbi:hypothetical protein TPE_0531 [Treponema pedis str. T A4]|uniref:Uncharacterized protein n=1 Tax=Treponema pedis str. T A4 TaxID=1291379 RepID=S5ZKC2_9SPIR|nr:hypothetical protein TPE_0531 [Treponema pedis str. T A4]
MCIFSVCIMNILDFKKNVKRFYEKFMIFSHFFTVFYSFF